MLTTILTFTNKFRLAILLKRPGLVKKMDGSYSIQSNNHKEIATLSYSDQSISIRFSGSMNLAQYEELHRLICEISADLQASIDDSDSMLGYLENGTPAFIVTNWGEWTAHLNKAKYKTLEGQMVKVLDLKGNELGSGMLTEYRFGSLPDQTTIIVECSLITLLGERTYSGERLYVEPTGQW